MAWDWSLTSGWACHPTGRGDVMRYADSLNPVNGMSVFLSIRLTRAICSYSDKRRLTFLQRKRKHTYSRLQRTS